jgi:PilZ domain
MGTRHDLRRQDRRPCEHKVTVTWHDARGDNKFAIARAIDISESGIRLQMPEPPPLHTYVMLRATKLGLLGNASVRYCVRTTASRYAVGAEFTAGLQWIPEKQADV